MTTKPYEELYQFHVQPFVHATQMESLAAYAASKGFRGFKSMYKKYVESLKAQSGTLYIENVTQFTNQPLELNAGEWEADDLGIHKKNGFNDEIACPHPIMPVERLVNIDTGEEKLQLAYRKGAVWRHLIVSKTVLASSNKVTDLAGSGIAVNSQNARAFIQYISDMENLNYDLIPEKKSTLMGYINRPSAVYVSVVPAAGTIAAGFSALAAYTYDYIAGPSDISAEDATALAALVKERRKLRYIGKAVLPNTAADYEGVINFVSAGIAAGGKTAFSAAAYCSRIAGMLAGTPAQCSATYAQLSEVTGVTATENPDAAVDAGKLFIIDDGRVRKLSRAVTSKVTIGDTEPEALKKIKMTAAIDLIRYYAVSSVEDDYFGKCANTYDDKCVLLLALQDYLKSLEDSKVLESGSSGAVLDADATRKYLITAAGDDATEAERIKKLSDNEVIKENTGSKVFLKLYGNIMDAMEDFAIVFEVSPSVIAA